MDIQQILNDPEAAAVARWGSSSAPQMTTVFAHINALTRLKPEIKEIQKKKQLCARAFGEAKRTGQPLDSLKAEMQQISTEVERLDIEQKQIQMQITALFNESPTAIEAAALPERFLSPREQDRRAATITLSNANQSHEWDSYVSAHENASIYHRYLWRNIIEQSFDQQCIYLAARDQHGAICGVLPMTRLKSRLFGDFNVSLPYFNYGGPLTDSTSITTQLLDHAAALTNANGQRHLEVRCTQRLNDWPARTDKVSMVLQLPKDIETLEIELGSKLRAQINRARREHPTIDCGGLELLEDFYRVFARNMRDLGTPVYARSFFSNILKALPDHAHLVVIRLNGQPVATAFLLGDRDLMEIPWASTLREVNALSINMLLYREVLRVAIEKGYAFFDFGRSTQDAGTYHFKRQWGAKPLQHYWHYALPGGQPLPALKPDNPKLQLLIHAWKRLPLPLANLIGPHIVRSLP